jgi:hypothetical protein
MIAVPGEITNRPATGGIITYGGNGQKLCLIALIKVLTPLIFQTR